MKGPARRKCICCKEFYRPDQRNLRHQRYCFKPACRKESKAQSQLRVAAETGEPKLLPGPGKQPASQGVAQTQSRLLA
jgi:hypothetical protein